MRWLVLVFLAAPAFAHDKKLDDYGCHTQFNRGQYHCHSGQFSGKIWKSKKKARAEMDEAKVRGEYRDEYGSKKKKKKIAAVGADGCSPMDARGAGRGRAQFGWTWNGLICGTVKGTRCRGRDCDRLYKTVRACERARYRCPTSTGYYRRLKGDCRKDDGCCNRSVKLMQANGTRQAFVDGCPKGFVNEMLRCHTSLSWCAPKPHTYKETSD